MRDFWAGFWLFLTFLVTGAVIMRPDVIDSVLGFVGAFLVVAGWATFALLALLPVSLVIGGMVMLWAFVDKRRNESMRQRDGSFPLQRINPKKPAVYFDPNQQVGSASAWVPGVGWVEYDGGAGWENQRQIAAMRSYVSRVQAAAPGDKALVDAAHELRNSDSGGFLNRLGGASSARWAEKTPKGWGDEPKPPAVQVGRPALPAPASPPPALPAPASSARLPLTLADAAAASDRSLVIFGQHPQTGDLAAWNLAETPHMRLHGSTQKGKTSAAMTVVAGLLAQGAQVVVLDPRGGKNWGEAADYAEVADVRQPGSFLNALRCIHAEYERRDAILASEGAKDISALRGPVRLHRLAVVVEEYGAQRVRAQAAGALEEIDHLLSIITSEAAASGVHVIAIDQRPTNYHPVVRANLGAVVVFNLPDEGAGRAAGYVRAHKLAQFHFAFDGEVYRAVDSRDFGAVVPRLGPLRYPPVLAPPVPASVRGGAFAGVSPEVGTENTATENAANTDMGKWYDYILDYMSRPEGAGLWQTPASGVRALARAMSVAELGNESGEANYVGLASRVSKQIREQAHLSTGDKLGVDVAQSKF